MVQKRRRPTVAAKKPTATTSKKILVTQKPISSGVSKNKLGDASLDWITDTSQKEPAVKTTAVPVPSSALEATKNSMPDKPAGVLKETKIGIVKQYSSEDIQKLKYDTPEVTPVLSGFSSTITKGKMSASVEGEVAPETDVKEGITVDGKKDVSLFSVSPAGIATEKVDNVFVTTKKEKSASIKNVIILDDRILPPQYEVKKDDVMPKNDEIHSQEPSAGIPDYSTSIVTSKTASTLKGVESSREDKIPPEKKKTAAVKRELTTKIRKWLRISAVTDSVKKGSRKVSATVVKPFKSDKKFLIKWKDSTVNLITMPVKAMSSADRKITQSMKNIGQSANNRGIDKELLHNIKSFDSQITKSAKDMIDSIIH